MIWVYNDIRFREEPQNNSLKTQQANVRVKREEKGDNNYGKEQKFHYEW